MKKEFMTSNTKFVYSKNELGYQDVLDRFGTASEITIITYNISPKEKELVDALRSAGRHCVINVITNIPDRFEKYYGDKYREKARQTINLYLSKLNPEKLGTKAAVYFDFSNHGKIIMTDEIVYIGSANYSEKSADNTEFGFISTDKEFINYINAQVLPDVKASAVPYYEYDYTALLLEANVVLSVVYNIKNKLYEEVYRLHDDFDVEGYYYVEYEASLTVNSLEQMVQIVKEACNIASDIYDAIDTITLGDEEETIEANDIYEELLTLCSRIEEIREFDTLIELSEFNPEEFVNQQLQNEYAMVAYEDNLENCIEIASGEATEIIWDLTQAAKNDIDELISSVDKFCEVYSEFIVNLRSRKLKKVSSQINNTQ